jgi:methionyl-tRNA formyltransferase
MQGKERIVFMGTPDFAVPSLRMLLEEGYEVAAVFTQPDKPKGRSGKLQPPPVKELALQHGLPVYQPERIKDPESARLFQSIGCDLAVVVAFGQILSKENLQTPRLGCVNVHGSLLPKYRGSAPVQWAVIDGQKVSGVTTMLMGEGVDTGDMLLQRELEIGPEETAGELFDRIAVLGAQTLKETLPLLLAGKIIPQPQQESQATHCVMLNKEHGHIDFSQDAQQVHNLVRGVNPWPGAFALLGGETLKIWRTRPCEGMGRSGEILQADGKNGLKIACGKGAVEVLELQAAGGKRMEAAAYLRGKPMAVGTVLE